MKRFQVVLLAALACLLATATVSAQFGANFFSKPNITDIFKPVVGNGAVYETQHNGKEATQIEMEIVGKEMVDGEQGWWMEMAHQDARAAGSVTYSKVLMTNEFKMKKIVFQQPGQPAMEMPFNSDAKDQQHMKDEMQKWHKVGTEPITVPAGTFVCTHWQKDDGKGDVWASDKVSPMGMVKMVDSNETMVLVKQITGATDHITGPVQKFDPQALANQMRQQRQKQ